MAHGCQNASLVQQERPVSALGAFIFIRLLALQALVRAFLAFFKRVVLPVSCRALSNAAVNLLYQKVGSLARSAIFGPFSKADRAGIVAVIAGIILICAILPDWAARRNHAGAKVGQVSWNQIVVSGALCAIGRCAVAMSAVHTGHTIQCRILIKAIWAGSVAGRGRDMQII